MNESQAAQALQLLLADHHHLHSEVQMDHFITTRAGCCHPWGMYVQALRELSGRYANYHNLILRRQRLKLDIESLRLESRRWCFTERQRIRRRRAEVELRERLLGLEFLDRVEPDHHREFHRFFLQALAIRSTLGDLTPQRRRELDEEFWSYNLRQKLAVDFVREGAPSANMLELIPSLPRAMRERLRSDLEDPGPLVEWYQSLEPATYESPNGALRGVDLQTLVTSAHPLPEADRDRGTDR